MIKLVVGLGNPGKEYERTRHNAGFWLVEKYAQASGFALRKDPKFKALVGKNAGGVWFLLPQSFMNLSGQPVQMLAGFFKIKPEEVLVVHDELDFEPGVARVKQGGGIAGHNGLRDISQRLSSHEYWRLRIGVGRPPAGTEGGDYVLQKPMAEEKNAIDQAIARSLQVLPEMLTGDMQAAIQKLHSSEPKPQPQPEKKDPPKKEVPLKEPEKKTETAPAKGEKAGLLKSLFGKK